MPLGNIVVMNECMYVEDLVDPPASGNFPAWVLRAFRPWTLSVMSFAWLVVLQPPPSPFVQLCHHGAVRLLCDYPRLCHASVVGTQFWAFSLICLTSMGFLHQVAKAVVYC